MGPPLKMLSKWGRAGGADADDAPIWNLCETRIYVDRHMAF